MRDASGLAFDVACHVGTLLAVVVYFWDDLWAWPPAALPSAAGAAMRRRLGRLMVVGTLPVVVVGLRSPTHRGAPADARGRARSPWRWARSALLVAERLRPRAPWRSTIGYGEALALGLRPGGGARARRVAVGRDDRRWGCSLGLRRDAAARFSFLLGRAGDRRRPRRKEGLRSAQDAAAEDARSVFAIGMVVSAVVGYMTIEFFLRYLATHRLDVFAAYRLALAAAVVAWLVARIAPPTAA